MFKMIVKQVNNNSKKRGNSTFQKALSIQLFLLKTKECSLLQCYFTKNIVLAELF